MRRSIFLALCLILKFSISYAAIEVYLGGEHFNSFEDYKKIDRNVSMNGIKLTNSTSPTHQAPYVLDPGAQKMNKISYNGGVHHVVVNFDQNWQNPKPRFILGEDELEYAIQEAMENKREPTLLISDPKKLRIMSYNPQKDLSFQAKTEKIDKVVNK